MTQLTADMEARAGEISQLKATLTTAEASKVDELAKLKATLETAVTEGKAKDEEVTKLKAAFPLVVWRAIHATSTEDVDLQYAWQTNQWVRRFNAAAKAAADAVEMPFMDTFGMSYAAGPEAHYQGIHLQHWYHIATAHILLNHICGEWQTGSVTQRRGVGLRKEGDQSIN